MADNDKFDCDRDCQQHGRNDQRITQLEQYCVEGRKDRSNLNHSVEELKEEVLHQNSDLQRRIGERLPVRHAITAGLLFASLMTTLVTINIASDNRIEEKLDALTNDVSVLKAVSAERRQAEKYQQQMLEEVRRFRQQSRDLRFPLKPGEEN